MPAYIDKTRQTRFITDDDDRNLSCIAGNVVAGMHKFLFWADIAPASPKNLVDLVSSDRGVCIPTGGERLAAIKRRKQTVRIFDGLAFDCLDHGLISLTCESQIVLHCIQPAFSFIRVPQQRSPGAA